MNQILNNSYDFKKEENLLVSSKLQEKDNRKYFIRFLKVYFFISISILAISLIYYTNKMYVANKNEKISQQLLSSYNVSMLYFTPDSSSNVSTDSNLGIIGILEISKIDLKYPILSNFSDELLKVAPCRFYGATSVNEVRKYLYCCTQL